MAVPVKMKGFAARWGVSALRPGSGHGFPLTFHRPAFGYLATANGEVREAGKCSSSRLRKRREGKAGLASGERIPAAHLQSSLLLEDSLSIWQLLTQGELQ